MRAWILILLIAAGLLTGLPSKAAHHEPYPGMRHVTTSQPYAAFVDRLKASVTANGLGIVSEACAHCGAKSIGVTIPGNQVIMVFKPQFAVRMLKASVPAGIEAPLRLYVTEEANGNAKLTYRQPSDVFGAYGHPDLDALGKELDGIFDRIVADATQTR